MITFLSLGNYTRKHFLQFLAGIEMMVCLDIGGDSLAHLDLMISIVTNQLFMEPKSNHSICLRPMDPTPIRRMHSSPVCPNTFL